MIVTTRPKFGEEGLKVEQFDVRDELPNYQHRRLCFRAEQSETDHVYFVSMIGWIELKRIRM
jgi:hypothetical protein